MKRWIMGTALGVLTAVLLSAPPAARARPAEPLGIPAARQSVQRLRSELPPLFVTVHDENGVPGRRATVYSMAGEPVGGGTVNARREILLQLIPERAYRLVTEDGRTVKFFLRRNASVTQLMGEGWTDGELIHLDPTGQRLLLVPLLRQPPV